MSFIKTEDGSNIIINMSKDAMESKLKSSCRLCLDEKRTKSSLYDVTSRRIQLTNAEILSLFTEIFPEQGDGLPDMICTKCENMLHLIIDFKFECQDNNEMLVAIYDTLHPKIEAQENVPEMLEEQEVCDGNMSVEALESEFEGEDSQKEEENFKQEKVEEYQEVIENNEQEIGEEMEPETIENDDLIVISVIEDELVPTGSERIDENVTPKNVKPRKKCSKCPVCEKMVEGPAKLARHMRVHEKGKKVGNKERVSAPAPHNLTVYSCNVCSKEFTTKSRMKKHLETHLPMSMREKSYVCHCGKQYLDAAALRTHEQITHSDNVPMYACEICNKEFTRKNYRDYHQRLHTSDKPHACEMCDFRTAKKHNLLRHMVVHSNEFNFECESCKKKFKRKTGLEAHRKTHASALSCSLRNYMCPVCQRAYQKISHLLVHLRQEHHIEVTAEEYDQMLQENVQEQDVITESNEQIDADDIDLEYAIEEITTDR